jgi:hypothetical protein
METSYKGEMTLGVCEKQKIKEKAEAIKEFNKILSKAAPLAAKAWKEEHEKTPFPLKSLSPARIKVLKTYMDKKKAEAYLKTLNEKLEQKIEKVEAYKEKKVKEMSEEDAAKLEERKKLTEEAYALLETKCKEVKAEIEKKKAEEAAKRAAKSTRGGKTVTGMGPGLKAVKKN